MKASPLPMLQIGSQVGPYRIVGELGGGGMGMVYRAVHTLLDRPAAIKVLRPEFGNYAMASDRFLTEARATTAIRHPGIVEIYDYGHTEAGNAFIAMELLEGKTLGARLAEHGRLSLVETMTLARRIAAPLAVAHERGVVHRDLKPDNVFLIKDHEGGLVDQVKILDFGIAKLENTATSNRTTMGLVLGTPAYMSPEQCRGSSDCDHRTDLYALGCIVFELLTGQPPYGTGLSSGELLAAHLQSPIPDLSRFVTVPSEIMRLVTRLLAKRPEDRPSSALEVVAEIDRWSATRGIAVPARRSSLRLAVVLASGIAVLLTALGGLYRALRSAPVAAKPDESDARTEAPTIVLKQPVVASPPKAVLEIAPPRPSAQAQPRSLEQPSTPPRSNALQDASVGLPAHSSPSPSSPPSAPAAKPHRAQPPPSSDSEVMSELGKASTGDVNTTVNDLDHK